MERSAKLVEEYSVANGMQSEKHLPRCAGERLANGSALNYLVEQWG